MSAKTTREQIIEAADQLFYRQGYDHTSFTDIADSVDISRGNFYYHFKTKDQILDAVIDLRLANTQRMLEHWELEGQDPVGRIRLFIQILLRNQEKIVQYGCPVGTLCTELAKLNHAAQSRANQLFTLFRTWLSKQFMLLGHMGNADALAMHLLARSQGVATLANAFQEDEFIRREVEQMCAWVESCAHGTAQLSLDEAGTHQNPLKQWPEGHFMAR